MTFARQQARNASLAREQARDISFAREQARDALEGAMQWANATAALSVTGRGALGGMPARERVARLLARE